ncbi:MAG: flagellar biosynthesis anti-sigma factor FlgM [Oscillospiraceae bacterium]|nr:flagellar biosynthesis anti-sigma factor FlgM [Oscillospiraceae bacterium]
MTISGTLTTNLSKPIELQRAYQPPQTNAAQTQKSSSFSRRFDSVTISEENSPVMEARRRLSNEVRTASLSAPVSAIREQIQQGNYHPDSMAIARNMLLFGEGG